MKRYLACQVVTVKQLKANDIMHCGTLSGKCVEWRVIATDGVHAKVKIGGTTTLMSSSDIRSGLPMFYARECPICDSGRREQAIELTEKPVDPIFVRQNLESADISSSLSGVQNLKRGGNKQGGATVSSQKSYFNRKALQLAERIIRAGG